MKQMYKAISLTISLCFLVNTTAYNMPMNSTINQSVIDELAAGSICNKMLGPVPYEKGTLKLALMASLNDIAGKDQKIDPKEVRKHAEKYRNNVFDKRHFFFAEHGELPDDRIWVKCRIEQQYAREHLQHIPSVDSYLEMEKKLLSTYYAVFSTAKKNNGFDVKMYTEKEWNNKWKQIYETGKSPEKYVSREEKIEEMGVDQYVYEHKLNIDKFIEKHIGEGNFAEIEGRAESEELNWDNKYPDRIKPEKFFSGKLWDFLQFNMNPFLKYFGGSIDKAFRKKNIVFIRVLNAEDLPVIRRNGQELPVTSHASENAVYVFLRENIFDTLLGKSKLFDEMAESQKTVDPLQTQNKWESLEIFCPLMNKCVIPRLMHEVGASYDFKWEVKGLSIVNALDVAWQKFQKELKEFVQKGGSAVNFDFTKFAEEFRKEIEDFKKFEGEPVKLDENILDRDYSGTEEEAVLGKSKKNLKTLK
ncbi:MAG: hypothetical protein ABIH09_05505 [Candidatus Omnitrophota bacterium]